MQFLAGGRQETLTRDANVALLDMIGTPVILLTHSQGGAFGWLIADARPNLVKAIVTVEPAAPPIKGVDTAKVDVHRRRRTELGRRQQPDHLRAGGRRAIGPADRARREGDRRARSRATCSASRRAS